MSSTAASVAALRDRPAAPVAVAHADLDYRPSYLAAGLVAAAVLLLYLVTLAPSTAMWDASEYIAAAYVLGLPHPPGNPFFILLGNVFGKLPIPGASFAVKINILAALCSAFAAGAWFLITERVLVSWLPRKWQRLLGASLAALIGATAFTVWNQSVVNEKVYTVSLGIFAIVSWLTVRWCDEPEGESGDKLLVLIAFLIGLGYANHPAGFLPVPAVGLAVLLRHPASWRNKGLALAAVGAVGLAWMASGPIARDGLLVGGWRASLLYGWLGAFWATILELTVWSVLAWLAISLMTSRRTAAKIMILFWVGMSPFATQPIRAAHFPAINEGEPTACTTEIGWSCTTDQKTVERFFYNFNREQYGKPSLGVRQAPFSAQVGMWWLYFKWQWLRDAHLEQPGLQNALGILFLGLGVIGGWVHWKRDQRSFLFFGPLIFTLTLLLVYYMNFKYGASQAPDLADSVPREVRDRDYFYLWSFSAWSVWAALGLVFLWETVASFLGTEDVELGGQRFTAPTERSWAVAAPVLALAFLPLMGNWSQASRAGQRDTRDFAHDLLNSVEPYGILVTVGDNDTFPLWYAQEVEGIRQDVVVANTSLLNTDWYTRQLIRRPVFAYDKAAGPAVFRDRDWPKPSGSVLSLTMNQADSVPLYEQLREPMMFKQDSLEAILDPRALQDGIVQRADFLVLQMIRDNWKTRPVFFSRTAGGYPQSLGFGPYLISQGLARKLSHTVPTPSPDTLLLQGEGFVDVGRTARLWNETFVGHRSITSRGDWVDKPSAGIPALYVSVGLTLHDALKAQGKNAQATAVLALADSVAIRSRTIDWFGGKSLQQQGAATGPAPATAIPLGDSAPR